MLEFAFGKPGTPSLIAADALAPTRIDQYTNDFAKLRRVCERLAKNGTLRACYEASGAGYVLQRAMKEWGYHCDVIAPSLIPVKPGVQRKHDKYDAGQLARLYRAGELTVIRIPGEAEERVRDVVRCRETLQREVVKSRHYILMFLARRGFIYRGGLHWRPAHYTRSAIASHARCGRSACAPRRRRRCATSPFFASARTPSA